MLATPSPTDQRAGARPISFVLDNAGDLGAPVTLTIRPEDLSRPEPLRATVHQTLGRNVSGWVDNFGPGLPSVSISGHTGWRYAQGSGLDGFQSFMALNDLIVRQFPEAQQQAIERGIDPAEVKLIFVDMLDDFAWSVIPLMFTLKRNKNRPLLLQYSMNLQAVDVDMDTAAGTQPEDGNVQAGLTGLSGAMDRFDAFDSTGMSMVTLPSILGAFPIGGLTGLLTLFATFSQEAFRLALSGIRGASSFSAGLRLPIVPIARSLAEVGRLTFQLIASSPSILARDRSVVMSMASLYGEVVCLLSNSLRDRQTYEDFSALYGASMCSSTTGGRPASTLRGRDVLDLLTIQGGENDAKVTSAAMASIAALSAMDPVLAPMSMSEVARHLGIILDGVSL